MLSRVKVRTKLLAIVLPLLVGLGVLSVIGVGDRISRRDAAERTVTYLKAVDAGSALVEQLQLERLAVVSPAGATGETLAERNAATDAAAATLWEDLAPIVGDEHLIGQRRPAQVVRAYRRQLDAIAGARPSGVVDPVDARGPVTEYSTITGAIIDLNAQLVGAAGEIGGASRSAQWIAAANEADARAAVGVMILARAGDKAGDSALSWVVPEIREQQAAATTYADVFRTQASVEDRSGYEALLGDSKFGPTINPFLALSTLQQGGRPSVQPAQWAQLAGDHLAGFRGFEQKLLRSDAVSAKTIALNLDREVRLFLGGVLAAMLLALLFAAGVTRSIVAAVGRLTRAATDMASEQLPRLVEALRSSDGPGAVHLEPIEVTSRDEFGELASAFNEVQRTAAEVAAEQAATLRKGISELFVNLARRNQTLLDRQIEFIDRLEANEEDPDQLENLFKLDHLATRMRRNAESLLVLAGSEAPRRRSKEVSITDVIRVAVGEVEDFARISLLAVDDAMALGSAAVDVAHLLSELMENGTQYSPPDRRVEIVGHRTNDGGYVISVSDQGVGMSTEQLRTANDLLARPPAVGLSLSRQLGFVVVATLASRHGIDVRLAPSPAGGVTAMVTLPTALVVGVPTVEVPVSEEPVEAGSPQDPVVADFASTLDHPSGTVRVAGSPFDYERESDEAPQLEHGTPVGSSAQQTPFDTTSTDPALAEQMFEPAPFGSLEAEPSVVEETTPMADPVIADGVFTEPVSEAFAPEEVPHTPAPSELDERVPMGDAFERGLFALLDDAVNGGAPGSEPPALPVAGPDDHGGGGSVSDGADVTARDLPTRTPSEPSGGGLRRVPVWSARPGPSPEAIPTYTPDAIVGPEATSNPLPRRHSPAEHTPADIPAEPTTTARAGDPWAPAAPPTPEETSEPAPTPATTPTPSSFTGTALPKRLPGGVAAHLQAEQVSTEATRVAAPGRAPDEVRSILSRYRSGLHSGRDVGEEKSGVPNTHQTPSEG